MSDRRQRFDDWGRWERLYWDDDPQGPVENLAFDPVDELEVDEPTVDCCWDRWAEDRAARGSGG